jgi:hypothetical protein
MVIKEIARRLAAGRDAVPAAADTLG